MKHYGFLVLGLLLLYGGAYMETQGNYILSTIDYGFSIINLVCFSAGFIKK